MYNPSHQSFAASAHGVDVAQLEAVGTHLRALLESVADGTWEWNLASGSVVRSPRWLARLGYEQQTPVTPAIVMSTIHPDDHARVRDAVTAHLRGDTDAFVCEYRQRTASGTWLQVLDRGRVVERHAGRAHRMVGAVTDSTSRGGDAYDLLRALPIAVYTTDADARLTFYNEAAVELWGCRPPLHTLGWGTAWKFTDPNGMPVPPEAHPLAVALREGRPVRGIEMVAEGSDGVQTHYLPFPTPLFDAEGRLEGSVNLIVDISERRRSEERLRESEAHYRHFIEVNPAIFWTSDPAGNITIASDSDARMLGTATNLADINGYGALVHPDDRDAVQATIAASLASGEPMDFSYRLHMRGRYRWVHTRAHARRDADGRILGWFGSSEDINRRRRAEEELRTVQERLRLALDGNKVGVWDWDVANNRLWLSDSAYLLQGYSPGEIDPGSIPLSEIMHPDDLEPFRQLARDTLAGRTDLLVSEHRLRTKGGGWAWVADRGKIVERSADGRAVRMVGTRADVGDRKTAEERIRWLASHDSLTGLANRRLFQEALTGHLARARAERTGLGLALLDMDGFKTVNDTLGHDAGDALLREFGERLLQAAGEGDIVARLGGDEFAVILPRATSKASLSAAMTNLLDQMRKPYLVQGRMLDCRASVGGSLYPDHGEHPDDLLKNADIALYVSKSQGRSGTTFAPSMRKAIDARTSMIRVAREAVAQDRILPFYQPKIALGTGALAGFEALLRWRDGARRLRPPAAIAAAFDDAELARALSDRMFGQITADMRRWLDAGLEFGHVAVNASPAEFRQDGYADRVLERLAAAGIPPCRLEVEVTESVFLGRGSGGVERTVRSLSGEGVRIALDDFGTGYASLTHLKQVPVDTIKIDRSFVRDLEQDPYDAAIVRAVLNLGQSLGIDIVAEGIETVTQAAHLRAQGCVFGQGYLFGRPTPGERLPPLIAEWRAEPHWRDAPAPAVRDGPSAG